MPRLVGEHHFLGAATALAFLPAEFLDALPLGGRARFAVGFNLVEQQFPSEEAIQSLLARFLTFYLCARGPVQEHHAGRYLVHVLTTVTAGADKGFFNV